MHENDSNLVNKIKKRPTFVIVDLKYYIQI